MEDEKEKIINEKTIDISSISELVQNMEIDTIEDETKEEPTKEIKKEKKILSKKKKIIIFSAIGVFLIGLGIGLYFFLFTEYKVTINYDNGEKNKIVSVKKNDTIDKPVDPKKTDLAFVNWFIVKDGVLSNEPFNFNTKITENMEIKAVYDTNIIEAESIDFVVDELTALVGETVQLETIITPTNTTDKTIIYESSKERIATVDENGQVTTIKKGTVVITATTANGKKAQMTLNIEENIIPVESVKVDPSIYSMLVGETKEFKVEVLPIDATNNKVTFAIQDRSIASVNKTGVVTAIKAGKTNLVVSAGEKKETIEITVNEKQITEVTLTPVNANIYNGMETMIKSEVTPADVVDKSLTYEVDNSNCATISSTGKLTTKTNASCPNETIVTVTATSKNNIKGIAKVVIYNSLEVKFDDVLKENNSTLTKNVGNSVIVKTNIDAEYILTCTNTTTPNFVVNNAKQATFVVENADDSCKLKIKAKRSNQEYETTINTEN